MPFALSVSAGGTDVPASVAGVGSQYWYYYYY